MNSLNEEWRDVVGFEGFYQVSSLGRVRSVDRHLVNNLGRKSFHKGQLLKPNLRNTGYLAVETKRSGRKRGSKDNIHVLVARAFKGDRPEGFEINHIDGDKLNNCADNLEYCSRHENIRHAYSVGLIGTCEKHHQAKLKDCEIPLIRQRILLGESDSSIARDFGVSSAAIRQIKVGKSWFRVS